MKQIPLADLRAEHFVDQIGCGFRVELPEHAETLTLERVDRTGRSPDPAKYRDPFSLFFKSESTSVLLNQHVFALDNDALGRLEVMLVPIGRDDDGSFRYQAVFC